MSLTRIVVAISAALLLGGCSANAESESPTTTVTTIRNVAPASTTTAAAPTTTTAAVGSCDESAFLTVFDSPVVLFCDGAWARAGQRQTDAVRVFQFQEDFWEMRENDGSVWPAALACYSEASLRADGAPEELINQTLLCEAPAL